MKNFSPLSHCCRSGRTTSRSRTPRRRLTRSGTARLVFAESPFGVAVTADGRASYDVQLEPLRTARALDARAIQGLRRLGRHDGPQAVAPTRRRSTNGKSTVGHDRVQQVPARHHGRVRFGRHEARGADRAQRHVAERVAADVPVASAVSRGRAVIRRLRAVLALRSWPSRLTCTLGQTKPPAKKPDPACPGCRA